LIHTVHNVLNYSRSPPAMLVDLYSLSIVDKLQSHSCSLVISFHCVHFIVFVNPCLSSYKATILRHISIVTEAFIKLALELQNIILSLV